MPESPLSALTGMANGTWTLNVSDNAAFDAGSLNAWSLAFPIPNSITTYSWSPATDLSSASVANPDATPAASQVYMLTVTDESGCSNSDSVQLTINTPPTVGATATATTVCEGTSVTFNGSGATSYAWTGGVTDNVAYTPTATDTYTVTGTDANGCTATATATVTVNTLPTVTANVSASAACEGASIIFTGGGASTFTWTGGVTDNVPFTPTATDTYTVTGTDGNGCVNTATTTVTVNTLPAVDLALTTTLVCIGDPAFTLGGESPAGGTWSGTGVTGNSFDPATAGAGASLITYTYTDGNGCSASDTGSVTVDLCTGIAAAATNDMGLNAYPNPVNDVVNLAITNPGSDAIQLQIVNLLGKEVYNALVQPSGNDLTTRIDVSSFAKGTYLLRVNTGSILKVMKIVKQ